VKISFKFKSLCKVYNTSTSEPQFLRLIPTLIFSSWFPSITAVVVPKKSGRRVVNRGLRVYPYPRIYPYPTRTRGSGTGRVNILRVRVGSGKQVTGTGIPEVYPWSRSKFNTTICGSESEDRSRQLRQERNKLDALRWQPDDNRFSSGKTQAKPQANSKLYLLWHAIGNPEKVNAHLAQRLTLWEICARHLILITSTNCFWLDLIPNSEWQ